MNAAFVTAAPLPNRQTTVQAHLTNGYRPTLFVSTLRTRESTRQARVHMTQPSHEPAKQASAPGAKKSSEPTSWETMVATAKKMLSVGALAVLLMLPADASLAARGGGRIGGSSFRAPAMRSAPSRAPSSYGSPGMGGGYGGGYGGGGYGYGAPGIFLNPFIMPFGGFGMGFGGLGTFLLLGAIASFVSDAARARGTGIGADEAVVEDPVTTVAVLKVGLLSTARALQVDLDSLARSADTSTVSGLMFVLQETVTTLLRHPDYVAYGAVNVCATSLSKAEGEFNRLALEERLKLDEETLTNMRGQRVEKPRAIAIDADLSQAPSEYIVVSLVVAAASNVVRKMPKNIDSVRDVDRALKAFASVSGDSLQAVEVIWAPQSLRDTLTEAEMLADHPELKQL